MSILKGLSIYSGLKDYTIDENLKYIKLAKERGIDFFFTSCHIDEAVLNEDFFKILKYCKEINMQLVVDVNKNAYELIKEYFSNDKLSDYCLTVLFRGKEANSTIYRQQITELAIKKLGR